MSAARSAAATAGLAPAARGATAEFRARAHQLGHDPAATLRPGGISTDVTVPTFEALRDLALAGPAQRAARQQMYFSPQVAARAEAGQGIHDRLEAYVFAAGIKDPVDEALASRHLPFPVHMASIAQHRVRAGETWNVSVRGERWGVDDRDDVGLVLNIGELHLEPGARIEVHGNLLILLVQELHCQGDGAMRPAIAILPTPFSLDLRRGPLNGAAGARGEDGAPGEHGTAPRTEPTLLGPRLSGDWIDGANVGTGGQPATAGGAGAPGRTGGATKTAEITIRALTGALTIVAAGGHGGDGGNGGAGGNGGDGGRGEPGVRAYGTRLPDGHGGRGGDAGAGGDGGRGGNGGICSNVFVTVPPAALERLHVEPTPARAGRPGTGGAAGQPGHAGAGPTRGQPGAPASRGADGDAGQTRPAPPVFINERANESPEVTP